MSEHERKPDAEQVEDLAVPDSESERVKGGVVGPCNRPGASKADKLIGPPDVRPGGINLGH